MMQVVSNVITIDSPMYSIAFILHGRCYPLLAIQSNFCVPFLTSEVCILWWTNSPWTSNGITYGLSGVSPCLATSLAGTMPRRLILALWPHLPLLLSEVGRPPLMRSSIRFLNIPTLSCSSTNFIMISMLTCKGLQVGLRNYLLLRFLAA